MFFRGIPNCLFFIDYLHNNLLQYLNFRNFLLLMWSSHLNAHGVFYIYLFNIIVMSFFKCLLFNNLLIANWGFFNRSHLNLVSLWWFLGDFFLARRKALIARKTVFIKHVCLFNLRCIIIMRRLKHFFPGFSQIFQCYAVINVTSLKQTCSLSPILKNRFSIKKQIHFLPRSI